VIDCPQFWFAIPVFNRIELTLSCLESIQSQSYKNYVVIICDDGSTDNSTEILTEKYPEVWIVKGDGNLWWTGATNECIRYILDRASADDFVVTLNNDLELADDYLREMVRAIHAKPDSIFMSASFDIANKQTMIEPGRRMNWFIAKDRKLDPKKYNSTGLAEVTHAPGRGTVFPIEVFKKVGLFDFEHFPQYAADYDLTHRATKSGYPIFINYDARLYSHVEETGLTAFRQGKSLSGLIGYLSDIKSPACLRYRWRYALKNCPKLLLPTFILLDAVFIVGSYFRSR
jgi:GT2 family glycosyltransferase